MINCINKSDHLALGKGGRGAPSSYVQGLQGMPEAHPHQQGRSHCCALKGDDGDFRLGLLRGPLGSGQSNQGFRHMEREREMVFKGSALRRRGRERAGRSCRAVPFRGMGRGTLALCTCHPSNWPCLHSPRTQVSGLPSVHDSLAPCPRSVAG